ncbi:esterase/lipase family protein [Paenibacillus chitinolyticus]|uniref:esterase/lipase family protein n=1 Tax=Paenibacillus chitinolyticus TaxID=79263 RepID=UPI00366F8402
MIQKVRARMVPLLGLSAVLACSSVVQAAPPPAPALHDDNPSGHFGDWYTGAVPPQASNDKPVILFVQGLHSNYNTWLKTDGYYEAAYKAGYRTAFVQLKDADGTGGDMWTNGPKLAEVIKKVAQYYGVSQINIIAHSKGGIDTQAALLHYGAAPYVNVVHQLSTPNKGSELADMAYSDWTSWLAEILGKKDDAVYSLQTSYMANFRTQTDSKPGVSATKTYMSGGEGDDGWFTAYWFAHAILPGEDDGAVSVASALGLPYGIKSFTKNISHSAMTTASQTWSLVQPKLALGKKAVAAAALQEENLSAASQAAPAVSENSSFIMKGGSLAKGTAKEIFPLESGLGSISLDVLTAKETTQVTLTSPSGKKITLNPAKSVEKDDAVLFSDAVHHTLTLENPEKGNWTLELSGEGDAYFMLSRPEGRVKGQIKNARKQYKQGENAQIAVSFDGAGKLEDTKAKKAKLTRSGGKGKVKSLQQAGEVNLQTAKNEVLLNFKAPTEPGVYNISFDINGVNERQEPFTRSVNYNFAVTDEAGKIE